MISPATKWCEMPSTRKVHQRLSTWGFTRRVMILSKYQDSSQPEGKQALGINHTVCSNSLGAVSDTYQIPKILAEGQPCKQAFFFFFLALRQVMQDFISPTRDRSHTGCTGSEVLITRPPRKSPLSRPF